MPEYPDRTSFVEFIGSLSFEQKFPTNRFVGNFLQPTYKNDTCPLNM
jgi:hypothetical protein